MMLLRWLLDMDMSQSGRKEKKSRSTHTPPSGEKERSIVTGVREIEETIKGTGWGKERVKDKE